jgi:hypothetical protein
MYMAVENDADAGTAQTPDASKAHMTARQNDTVIRIINDLPSGVMQVGKRTTAPATPRAIPTRTERDTCRAFATSCTCGSTAHATSVTRAKERCCGKSRIDT